MSFCMKERVYDSSLTNVVVPSVIEGSLSQPPAIENIVCSRIARRKSRQQERCLHDVYNAASYILCIPPVAAYQTSSLFIVMASGIDIQD